MKITDLSFQILRYLPPQFDNLVQSILYWTSDKFKFKSILTELIAEKSRLKLRNEDRNEEQSAHVQYAKPKTQQMATCYRCGKPSTS